MRTDLPKFESLFKEHFASLAGYASKFIVDRDEAKAIVHETFVNLWERFDKLPTDIHYKSYLYTAVRNRCLNALRDRKKHVMLDESFENRLEHHPDMGEAAEVAEAIESGIASLPEKCREVFELNRIEGLKYSQIADRLGISIKTVEAQMSKALTVLREHLKEFLTIIFYLIFT